MHQTRQHAHHSGVVVLQPLLELVERVPHPLLGDGLACLTSRRQQARVADHTVTLSAAHDADQNHPRQPRSGRDGWIPPRIGLTFPVLVPELFQLASLSTPRERRQANRARGIPPSNRTPPCARRSRVVRQSSPAERLAQPGRAAGSGGRELLVAWAARCDGDAQAVLARRAMTEVMLGDITGLTPQRARAGVRAERGRAAGRSQ
jgi:hypothetical protein